MAQAGGRVVIEVKISFARDYAFKGHTIGAACRIQDLLRARRKGLTARRIGGWVGRTWCRGLPGFQEVGAERPGEARKNNDGEGRQGNIEDFGRSVGPGQRLAANRGHRRGVQCVAILFEYPELKEELAASQYRDG